MNEIYWLTRIGVIGNTCEIVAILGLVLFVFFIACFPLWDDLFFDDEKFKKKAWRVFKILFAVWIISIIGVMFIPTKKEMIAIYGIGTTIDYIKSSDKAKELPDKAVEALTKYLDSVSEDDKKE